MLTRFQQVIKYEQRTIRVTLNEPVKVRVRPHGNREPRDVEARTLLFRIEDYGNGFGLPLNVIVGVNDGAADEVAAYIDRDNDPLKKLVIPLAARFLDERNLKKAPSFRNPQSHD